MNRAFRTLLGSLKRGSIFVSVGWLGLILYTSFG